MALTQPTIIPTPWATDGTYAAIPEQTSAAGRASWTAGFPPECAMPLSAGGVPPHWLDFQGVLHALSEHAVFQQSGGRYSWSSDIDYPAGACVLGSDGIVWQALQASGPGHAAGAKDPAGNANPAFWGAATTPDGVSIVFGPDGKLSVADVSNAFAATQGTTVQRTLADRFSDVVTVKDFGAKGDGTNATAAFQAAAATGKLVFVPAGRYLITARVDGDFYSNGNVELVTENNVPSDRFIIIRKYKYPSNISVSGGHTPIDIFSGALKSSLVVKSDQRGTGSNSRAVVQSVAYDPINKLLYMLHEKDAIPDGNGARYAAISRHSIETKTDVVTTKDISSLTLDNVGHQGLAVEVTHSLNTATTGLVVNTGEIKLWSSNKYGLDGGTALRFSYKANDAVQDVEEYKLVDFYGTNLSLTPTISYDQRFLLVVYRVPKGDGTTEARIRVFSLKTLVDGGPGDYTDNYLNDFTINIEMADGDRGFQCMACDGYYVYILAGKAVTYKPSSIYCYTLDGQLVQANKYVTLGFKEAFDVNASLPAADRNENAFCEPEAIFFMPVNGVLRLCYAVNVQSPFVAAATAKALYVYALGNSDCGCLNFPENVLVANNISGGSGFLKIETEFTRDGTAPSNGKLGGLWHYDNTAKALGGFYHQISSANYSFWNWTLNKNISTLTGYLLRFMAKEPDSADNAFFGPYVDSSYSDQIDLGTASHPWQNSYCQGGVWTGSDERIKDNIADVDTAVFKAWGKVRFKAFQMKEALEKKGSNARIHVGVIAQAVQTAFASEGLDASRFGLFCHDVWTDEIDERGSVVKQAGDVYGIRYQEALALECAYQRRRADRAEARLAALEERLAKLELVLGSPCSPVAEEPAGEVQDAENQ